MSKLNQVGKRATESVALIAANRGEAIGVSMNGNVQFKKETLQHLYELAVSTLYGKDTFYRSTDQLMKNLRSDIREVVAAGQNDFIANVAVHARTQMNIRTIPIVMVVEFAKALSDARAPFLTAVKDLQVEAETATKARKEEIKLQIADLNTAVAVHGYENMRRLVCDVIQRADQINDMYAYALEVFGGKNKIPMAIKRGVADAFNKFGEYHFAKYNRDGAVKFRDVLRIVHPEAKNEKQGFIFEKIMKETLEAPYTWEVELSRNGQKPAGERKSDKVIWTELLQSGKLGYMALLRNLRNIVQAGVADDVMKTFVADVLRDPVRVAESKQFPHAFVLAYRAAQSAGAPQGLLRAISEALDLSCKNIPQLGDKVALLVDSSGSMQGGYYGGYGYGRTDTRGDTSLAPADHASVLAAALLKANSKAWETRVYYFDSTAKRINVNTNKSVIELAQELRDKSRGGATLMHTAFDLMNREGYKPDVLVALSDMEVNQCAPGQLRTVDKDCIKVAVNLNSSDTTPLSSKDGWYQLAGWSDKMFKFIPAMRESVTVVDRLNVPYIGADVMKAAVSEDAE